MDVSSESSSIGGKVDGVGERGEVVAGDGFWNKVVIMGRVEN